MASLVPAPDLAAPQALCPKCQKTLTDPHGLGWCQACGYCRSLGDVCVAAEKPADKPAPVMPSAPPPPRGPLWIIALIAGMVVLAGATWTIEHALVLKPLHRATWTTVQIAAGVVLMLVGQCYALIRVAPEDAALHAFDAVVPFRLYGLVFQRLPKLCAVLFFACWGLTLIATAPLLVGGLSHWLTYLPKGH